MFQDLDLGSGCVRRDGNKGTTRRFYKLVHQLASGEFPARFVVTELKNLDVMLLLVSSKV